MFNIAIDIMSISIYAGTLTTLDIMLLILIAALVFQASDAQLLIQ